MSLKLACKSVTANPWQYVMLALILSGVTFASSFAVLTYSSLAVDPAAFVALMGEEMGDVNVSPTRHADLDRLTSLLLEREGVRKVTIYDTSSVSVGGELVTAQLAQDYSQMETASVYEGSFPVYDNEIVLTGRLAKLLGKRIGDSVTVERSGVRAQYVVCGYNQTVNNFGLKCMLTLDGLRRIDPDYRVSSLIANLEEGVDSAQFIRELEREPYVANPSSTNDEPAAHADARRRAEEKLQNLLTMYGVDSVQFALMDGDQILFSGDTSLYLIDTILDQGTLMESTVGTYVVFVGALCTGILALAGIIGFLILHLVVSATVVRRKREFGIYKALGYTSRQLRVQIALGFLPVSVVGVTAGVVLGGLLTGSVLSFLMSSMGISHLQITVAPLLLAVLAAAVLLLTFLIALAAARPVKRISVYELFSE